MENSNEIWRLKNQVRILRKYLDQTSAEKKEYFKRGAEEAYKKCSGIVKKGLKPYNTVRLGLALNYSVFQYEIM